MKITELDYFLPSELIAQQPIKDRDRSRLLVLHKESGEIEHRIFFEIVEYLKGGDLLVINNTKVIPARLIGKKPTGGKLELLLIKEKKSEGSDTVWEIMTKGDYEGKIFVEDKEFLIRKHSEGKELLFIQMNSEEAKRFIYEKGFMPLPPYIRRKPENKDRQTYQTVYAKESGSIAAPTAGLHFTNELLHRIVSKGISLREITLHVGVGTFKTIKTADLKEHQMDSEYFEIERKLLDDIKEAKQKGNRVFCVGTTTTRALEGYASQEFIDVGSDEFKIRGYTNIFIYPPYKFKIVDALITNFHLPRSTPLSLVYAFCDPAKMRKAYEIAVEKRYRFFSYGDAMLIL